MEKRLDYIDICKWIGISFVIFGHLKMPNEFLQWIYAFHMPLFFVLAGYTFRPQKFNINYVTKKIKAIYIPFLLFALIFCQGEMSSWAFIGYGSRNSLEIANTNTVLWFLPCYLISILIFASLMSIYNRYMKYQIPVLILSISFLFAGYFLLNLLKDNTLITKFGFPFNFDIALIGTIFMFAGYGIRKIIEYIEKANNLLLPSLTATLFAITAFTVYVNLPKSLNPACDHIEMCVGAFGNFPLFLGNALMISTAIIGLSILIDKYIVHKNLLLFIGKNSLTIMCIHGVIILVITKLFSATGLNGTSDIELIWQGVIAYAIVIIVSVPTILIIQRFVPNLAGK